MNGPENPLMNQPAEPAVQPEATQFEVPADPNYLLRLEEEKGVLEKDQPEDLAQVFEAREIQLLSHNDPGTGEQLRALRQAYAERILLAAAQEGYQPSVEEQGIVLHHLAESDRHSALLETTLHNMGMANSEDLKSRVVQPVLESEASLSAEQRKGIARYYHKAPQYIRKTVESLLPGAVTGITLEALNTLALHVPSALLNPLELGPLVGMVAGNAWAKVKNDTQGQEEIAPVAREFLRRLQGLVKEVRDTAQQGKEQVENSSSPEEEIATMAQVLKGSIELLQRPEENQGSIPQQQAAFIREKFLSTEQVVGKQKMTKQIKGMLVGGGLGLAVSMVNDLMVGHNAHLTVSVEETNMLFASGLAAVSGITFSVINKVSNEFKKWRGRKKLQKAEEADQELLQGLEITAQPAELAEPPPDPSQEGPVATIPPSPPDQQEQVDNAQPPEVVEPEVVNPASSAPPDYLSDDQEDSDRHPREEYNQKIQESKELLNQPAFTVQIIPNVRGNNDQAMEFLHQADNLPGRLRPRDIYFMGLIGKGEGNRALLDFLTSQWQVESAAHEHQQAAGHHHGHGKEGHDHGHGHGDTSPDEEFRALLTKSKAQGKTDRVEQYGIVTPVHSHLEPAQVINEEVNTKLHLILGAAEIGFLRIMEARNPEDMAPDEIMYWLTELGGEELLASAQEEETLSWGDKQERRVENLLKERFPNNIRIVDRRTHKISRGKLKALQSNKKLQEWSQALRKHGQLYDVVNEHLITSAAIPFANGGFLSTYTEGRPGLPQLENLQKAMQNGQRNINVLFSQPHNTWDEMAATSLRRLPDMAQMVNALDVDLDKKKHLPIKRVVYGAVEEPASPLVKHIADKTNNPRWKDRAVGLGLFNPESPQAARGSLFIGSVPVTTQNNLGDTVTKSVGEVFVPVGSDFSVPPEAIIEPDPRTIKNTDGSLAIERHIHSLEHQMVHLPVPQTKEQQQYQAEEEHVQRRIEAELTKGPDGKYNRAEVRELRRRLYFEADPTRIELAEREEAERQAARQALLDTIEREQREEEEKEEQERQNKQNQNKQKKSKSK